MSLPQVSKTKVCTLSCESARMRLAGLHSALPRVQDPAPKICSITKVATLAVSRDNCLMVTAVDCRHSQTPR